MAGFFCLDQNVNFQDNYFCSVSGKFFSISAVIFSR